MSTSNKDAAPPYKTVNVEVEVYETIKTEAARLEIPMKDYVKRKLSAEDNVRVTQEREIEAFILKRLTPAHIDLLKECCADTGLEPLDYILSYCHRMFDIGEGSYVNTEEVEFAQSQAAAMRKNAKCEWCMNMFEPRNLGQRFCSYECGKAQDVDTMHKLRPRTMVPDKNAILPPRPTQPVKAGV